MQSTGALHHGNMQTHGHARLCITRYNPLLEKQINSPNHPGCRVYIQGYMVKRSNKDAWRSQPSMREGVRSCVKAGIGF